MLMATGRGLLCASLRTRALEEPGLSELPLITLGGRGREIVRHYLIQIMTTFKMVLTSFKAEGGNTYVVSLKEGASHCNCESWRRGNGAADCKHIRALRALIARGEL
jgi:predicted nucleic acid-binding Zn finger protein